MRKAERKHWCLEHDDSTTRRGTSTLMKCDEGDEAAVMVDLHMGAWGWWGPARFPRVQKRGSDDGVARAIACLGWAGLPHTQDKTRHEHEHEGREEQPHTSAPPVCAHLVCFPNRPRRCDNSYMVFATTPRQWLRAVVHKSAVSRPSAWRVQPRCGWNQAMMAGDRRRRQAQAPLADEGRSSSFARGVVATSRSGARMKVSSLSLEGLQT
jgi:hypothetical protein